MAAAPIGSPSTGPLVPSSPARWFSHFRPTCPPRFRNCLSPRVWFCQNMNFNFSCFGLTNFQFTSSVCFADVKIFLSPNFDFRCSAFSNFDYPRLEPSRFGTSNFQPPSFYFWIIECRIPSFQIRTIDLWISEFPVYISNFETLIYIFRNSILRFVDFRSFNFWLSVFEMTISPNPNYITSYLHLLKLPL